tara:strand:- start:1097 stop:1597 length:501 start_codon:yes stop_codon:yes gene_type:complete
VFFDRDGVLNELVERDGGFFSPRNVKEFKVVTGASEVIEMVRSKGFLCIVVSNQPDVPRGFLRRSVLDKITQTLVKSVDIDDVQYCLHDDSDECDCRKPAPGLLLRAKEKWNLDLPCSFMVGDTVKDLEAANGAEVKFYLLDRPYNQPIQAENRIDNLRDIIGFLD